MLVGDPAIWADRFKSLDVRFLECVAAVWARCLAVLPGQPDEDTITINLVDILSKDTDARRLFHHLAYQHEPFGYTAEGTAYSKGKIDMALLLDQERERYLAYECKRLNVMYNGSISSLATRYVSEGVARFVTEQYAENIPVGGMLGYVMDGDVAGAQTSVHVAINAQKSAICLAEGPLADQSLGKVKRFFSRHLRPANGQEIEIRHALLPFPQRSAKKSKPFRRGRKIRFHRRRDQS
jgi:hypothetical protein